MTDPLHPEGKLVKAAIVLGDKVYTGYRHAQIRTDMIISGIPQDTIDSTMNDPWKVGFITENGRFLTRKQSLPYARSIKQINKIIHNEICSEDLWDEQGQPL